MVLRIAVIVLLVLALAPEWATAECFPEARGFNAPATKFVSQPDQAGETIMSDRHLFVARMDRLVVLDAKSLAQVATIDIPQLYYGRRTRLLLHGTTLVVVDSRRRATDGGQDTVGLVVLIDVRDPTKPEVLKAFDVDIDVDSVGPLSLVSIVDDHLVLIGQSSRWIREKNRHHRFPRLPQIRTSVDMTKWTKPRPFLPCTAVLKLETPTRARAGLLVVARLDLKKHQLLDATGFLLGQSVIFGTERHLYIASNRVRTKQKHSVMTTSLHEIDLGASELVAGATATIPNLPDLRGMRRIDDHLVFIEPGRAVVYGKGLRVVGKFEGPDRAAFKGDIAWVGRRAFLPSRTSGVPAERLGLLDFASFAEPVFTTAPGELGARPRLISLGEDRYLVTNGYKYPIATARVNHKGAKTLWQGKDSNSARHAWFDPRSSIVAIDLDKKTEKYPRTLSYLRLTADGALRPLADVAPYAIAQKRLSPYCEAPGPKQYKVLCASLARGYVNMGPTYAVYFWRDRILSVSAHGVLAHSRNKKVRPLGSFVFDDFREPGAAK